MDMQPPQGSFNSPESGAGLPPIAVPPPVIPLSYATKPLEPLPTRPTPHLVLVILLVIGALRAGVAYWNLYNGTGAALGSPSNSGSPYNFGYVTGSYVVGPIVLAIGLAYLAWFIFRRSNLAFNLVACLLLVLTFASEAVVSRAGMARRGRVTPNPAAFAPAVAEVDRMKAELRAQMETSGVMEGMSVEQMNEHMKRMDKAVAGANGVEGQVLRAAYNFEKRVLTGGIKARAPMEELTRLGGIDASGVKAVEEIDDRLKLARDYRRGLGGVATLCRNWRKELLGELTKAGIPITEAQAIVRDTTGQITPKFELAQEVYDLEESGTDEIIAVLEVLRDAWGRWHYHEEEGELKLIFEDDDDMKKYNSHFNRLNEVIEKQTRAARRQLGMDK